MDFGNFLDRLYLASGNLIQTSAFRIGLAATLVLFFAVLAAAFFQWLRRRKKAAAEAAKDTASPTTRTVPDRLRSEDLELVRIFVLFPEVARRLTALADSPRLAKALVEQVRILLPAYREIALFGVERDAKGERLLVFREGFGFAAGKEPAIPVPVGKGLLGVAAEQSMMLWRDEIEDRFGRQAAMQDKEFQYYAPSVVVPLVLKDRLLGCLALVGGEAAIERTNERRLLALFADLAAISISHATQVGLLDQNNKRLQEQAHALGEFNRNLQAMVATQVAELRQTELRLMQTEQLALFGEFVATLAHDVKTPLAFISGEAQWATEILAENSGDMPGLRNSLAIIQKNSVRLKHDLETLLQKVRLPELVLETVSLRRVLEEVHGMVESHAARLGVEVRTQLPETAAEISGYSGLLRNAFMNLVTNALEAMPEGGTLTLALAGGPHDWQVHITDTGRGITVEDLPHIFDLFFTRRTAGTGLGLSSVKRIIEKHHGGQIEVSSTLGKGTVFSVVLPTSRKGEAT